MKTVCKTYLKLCNNVWAREGVLRYTRSIRMYMCECAWAGAAPSFSCYARRLRLSLRAGTPTRADERKSEWRPIKFNLNISTSELFPPLPIHYLNRSWAQVRQAKEDWSSRIRGMWVSRARAKILCAQEVKKWRSLRRNRSIAFSQ